MRFSGFESVYCTIRCVSFTMPPLFALIGTHALSRSLDTFFFLSILVSYFQRAETPY